MSYDNKRQPQSAQDFLIHAANTLDSRGQQYDPSDKQERSMTAIVASFNAIYPKTPLTVHMGWQFMSLVKMVRGATKPHLDSALDQVAYASLAAEEVASELHKPTPPSTVDALMKQIRAGYKGCPQCGADVDKEAGSCQCGWEFEEEEFRPIEVTTHFAGIGAMPYVDLTPAKRVEQLLAHTTHLEAQLATLRHNFAEYACRFDLSKEYMTKEQVLAGQAKHEEQVAELLARGHRDVETINSLKAELAILDQINKAATAEIDKLNHQIGVDSAVRQGLVKGVKEARDKVSMMQAEVATANNHYDKARLELREINNSLHTAKSAMLALFDLLWQYPHSINLKDLWASVRSHAEQNSIIWGSTSFYGEVIKPEVYVDPYDAAKQDTVEVLRAANTNKTSAPNAVGSADPTLACGGQSYLNEPKAAPYMVQNSEPTGTLVSVKTATFYPDGYPAPTLPTDGEHF